MNCANDPSVQPSTPRKRIFTNKVKSGCLTCRQRRLKCDEKKPSCSRCTTSGRSCIGLLYGTQQYQIQSRFKTASIPSQPSQHMNLETAKAASELFHLLPPIVDAIDDGKNGIASSALWIGHRYIPYLPLGQDGVLDIAIMCLVAKSRLFHVTNFDSSSYSDTEYGSRLATKTIVLYGNALQRLQEALFHAKKSLLPETFLAAQLLCSYELLDEKYIAKPGIHIRGLASIIQHFGSIVLSSEIMRKFTLDYIGVFSGNAYRNSLPCFLFEDRWRTVLTSIASKETRRTRMIVEVSVNAGPIFNLLADCTRLICSQPIGNELQSQLATESQRRRLLARLEGSKHEFLQWHDAWLTANPEFRIRETILHSNTAQPISEDVHYFQCTGLCQAVKIAYYRMHVALGGDDALSAEQDAQRLAHDLQTCHPFYHEEFPPLYVELRMVEAALSTENEWIQAARRNSCEVSGSRLIAEEVFRRWLTIAGIHPTD